MRLANTLLVLLLFTASLSGAQNLAITDATIYTSPQVPPLHHAAVLILNGKIASIGSAVRVPAGALTLPCKGCVVFAGFWNCHVHFTGSQWSSAATAPAAGLTQAMQKMLTHSGFTSVVDLASDTLNTSALRRRVESGEVLGPRILTAGGALYPPHAIPFYLDDLPESVRSRLFQPATPAEAVQDIDQNTALGTNVVKLFTGSYVAPGHVVTMPLGVAKAAVGEGHKHGQLVFAHPSNLEGVRVAMESGVDILAHSPDTVDGIDDTLLTAIVAHHMAMVPTLKLFSSADHIDRIRQIVARVHSLGGDLLFGTDTGFLPDDSVAEEYRQLALAGLSFRDVLTMLTIAPAAKLRLPPGEGTLQSGAPGDLTILASDPAVGKMEDFTNVRYTIHAGKVIFSADAQ